MAASEPFLRKATPFPRQAERTATPSLPNDYQYSLWEGSQGAFQASPSQPTLEQPQPVAGRRPRFLNSTDAPAGASGWDDFGWPESSLDWESTDGSDIIWETDDLLYNFSPCQSAETVIRKMPKVDSFHSRSASPLLESKEVVVGICCRKHDGIMQYQKTVEIVGTKLPSPQFWRDVKDGGDSSSSYANMVLCTQKSEWLKFGSECASDAIKAYLQKKGFGGLYSSIVEGAQFPFPVGEGTWTI